MFDIHLLPAGYGDSLFIIYGTTADPHYILIDGGPYYEFKKVLQAIKQIAPGLTEIELLVVTHIDVDHIDGIVKLLNQNRLPFRIKQIWYNGYKEMNTLQEEDDTLGAVQGEYLTHLIKEQKIRHNTSFKGGAVRVKDFSLLPVIDLPGGMQLLLLSPGTAALQKMVPVWEKEVLDKIEDLTKIKQRLESDYRYESEDDVLGDEVPGAVSIEELQEARPASDHSAANGSSIAFIATFEGKRCLLTGDTPSDLLLQAISPLLEQEGLEKLKVDAWKLAHHGSRNSTLDHLMKKIDCPLILVSSDGKKYKHPHEETVAKLLLHNGPDLQFYFNYKTDYNTRWDNPALMRQYQFQAHYPKAEANGISVQL